MMHVEPFLFFFSEVLYLHIYNRYDIKLFSSPLYPVLIKPCGTPLYSIELYGLDDLYIKLVELQAINKSYRKLGWEKYITIYETILNVQRMFQLDRFFKNKIAEGKNGGEIYIYAIIYNASDHLSGL